MLSHRLLEVTLLWLGQNPTVFGQCKTSGLSGPLVASHPLCQALMYLVPMYSPTLDQRPVVNSHIDFCPSPVYNSLIQSAIPSCIQQLQTPISLSLLKFMSIELMMLSNRLILYHPLLLLPYTQNHLGVIKITRQFNVFWKGRIKYIVKIISQE